MIPGEILVDERQGEISANAGRVTAEISVSNTGDRPIQVGSHFHFFESNRALRFDRQTAYGMRLNIAAGTAVRFEPGETKVVTLIALAGARVVFGHNGWVDGALDAIDVRTRALVAAAPFGSEAMETGKKGIQP